MNQTQEFTPTSYNQMMQRLRAERDALILEQRAAGWTFAQIGRYHGMTAQRVFQIYQERADNGYPPPAEPTPALGDSSA